MEATQLTEAPVTKKKKSASKRQGAKAAGKAKIAATPKKKMSYARLTNDNRKWAAQIALEKNRAATEIVNLALDAIRTGTKFNPTVYEPPYLKKMIDSRNARLKRLERIAKD